jgi:peptide/nickel transport system substrate-binding protein
VSPKKIFNLLTKTEKIILVTAVIVFLMSSITRVSIAMNENSVLVPVYGGVYREGMVGQPVAINPIISSNSVDEDISALIYSPLSDLITHHTTEGEDGRVHTIKIEEGLQWSDGEPLTSDDVIFTIRTIQDPATQSPHYKAWESVVVERVSELQIQVTLSSKFVFFEDNIASLYIIPKHIYGVLPPANLALSSYNIEPIGSGKYEFYKIEKKKNGFISDYILRANEKYYGDKPFIEFMHIKFYEDEKGVTEAFERREVDGFGYMRPMSRVELNTAVINEIPMSRYYALFFNQNLAPILKNDGLRIALDEAIDKERIVRDVWNDRAYITQSPVLITGEENDEEESLELRIENAKERIEKIKIREESISLTIVVPEIDFLVNTANIIKENWNLVGIDEVHIVKLGLNELFEDVIKTNNYEILLFGNSINNPSDIFPFWHSSERFYPGRNLSLYKSQKADTLMEEIRHTEEVDVRRDKLTDLEEIITKDNPAIFLYEPPYTYVYERMLKGFSSPSGLMAHTRDRYKNISQWHIMTARVIKTRE